MAGSVPAGRAAHSACLIEPGGSIVVFGGTNGQRPFDELWLLHVGSSRWEQLRLPSSLHKDLGGIGGHSPPRALH